MKRATDTDPMNDRMGMGAANSFTYGANTVIERATMLQMEMAWARCLKGNILSSPKLAEYVVRVEAPEPNFVSMVRNGMMASGLFTNSRSNGL